MPYPCSYTIRPSFKTATAHPGELGVSHSLNNLFTAPDSSPIAAAAAVADAQSIETNAFVSIAIANSFRPSAIRECDEFDRCICFARQQRSASSMRGVTAFG